MTTEILRAFETPYRSVRGWIVLCLGLLLLVLQGAGPPEVVRLRVPAENVGRWFPPGTEIRGLPVSAFDDLFASARRGYERQAAQPSARLLNARHSARWNSGLLTGRSELVIEASAGPGQAELILSPWSPGLEPAAGKTSRLRMHDDGRTGIEVVRGTQTTVTLNWQLRARPGSQGRGFSLSLPQTATSSLSLDLPRDWTPEGPDGIRTGPVPADETGRMFWRFDGRGGEINLQLHGRRSDEEAAQEPRAWVSGPTQIELGEALANWTMEWTVDLDPRAPRRFQVELDRGLDFASVTGPAVEESRAEVVGEVIRVTIMLDGQVSGPTPVVIRAVSRIPVEGPWPVPAARPLDAIWTGGKTSVRLDASRLLKDCREEAGRRVPARPTGELSDPNLLVFEADEPRSVAVLTFAKPRADISVEVRGQLLLGNSAPQLESQLTWRVHRGRLLALDVDLPPAWVPERVQVVGIDEPLAWHPRTLPGGGVRVHVTPPSGDFARSALVLNLAASASIAGGRGPITLPRVRPVGVQVLDERWLAWTESGVTLHPAQASGLAWIDPSLVIGPSNDRTATPSGLREALAWRWIADQAEARVNRERVQEKPRGSIELLASVDRDRLRLDWRISVDAGEEPLRFLPIVLPDPIQDAGEWRFTDEVTSAELVRKPIDAARRVELGLPESGQAWELAVPDSASGPVVVRSHLEVPWKGQGRIPLLAMPGRYLARHFVIVDVARHLQSSVESTGLQKLEPTVAEEAIKVRNRVDVGDEQGLEPVSRRRAYAFSYTKPGGRLEVQTEALEPAPGAGVIDQAVLTTYVDPQGPLRQRLTLRVSIAEARVLDLSLPEGSTLVRAKRDGQSVVPARNGLASTFPLPFPTSSRNSCTFVVDYLTPRRASAADQAYSPERPVSSLPYLAFRWEVVVPDPWVVADHGSALTAGDPDTVVQGWRRFLPTLRFSKKSASRRDVEVLHSIDLRAVETTFTEMTLGECFTRWDGGDTPLVIDRMALDSGGWGPKSRVSPRQNRRVSQGAAAAVLNPLGLTLIPLGEAVLVTTRWEAPDRPGGDFRHQGARAAWEERIRQAVVNGSDVSDRFQVVARWRGETTRRAQSGSETIDVDPGPNGRRIWRFTSSGWPESGTTIHLVDENQEWAWAWAAGLAVMTGGVAGHRLSSARRAIGLASLLLVCGIVMVCTAPRCSALATGGAAGALAVFFYGLGEALPPWPRRRGHDARALVAARPRSGAGIVTTVLVAFAFLIGGNAARLKAAYTGAGASAGPGAAIVVLYPFHGAADPAHPPDQALIRLEDYERLRALAALNSGKSASGSASASAAAVAALHRVTWQAAGGVVIESEIELMVQGPFPVSWVFPVGKARDLSATLDDVATPIQVHPGGLSASVSILGEGQRTLRLRRFVTPRRIDQAESISFPINILASSRVEIGPGPAGRLIDVSNARGLITSRAGSSAGNLGPVDRLEVRWVSTNEQERVSPVGAAEAQVLWDAEPAGDRVRARLTYRNPEGTSVVRLQLDPGVVVRSTTAIPGQSDVGLLATSKGIEWVAHINPPLPDGATIRLEFWRPYAPKKDDATSMARTLPKVEPLGVESYSGVIGFRRPADWAGRLSPVPGTDPITEESFVRSWGNLPEEPLTLSGVTRFLRTSNVMVRSGPQPSRLMVRPVVELNLGPGRVEVKVEARLTQVSGRTYESTFEVPDELQVVRIEGEGLSDWSRTARQIRLRFDGAPSKSRTIYVHAMFPVEYDPLATGTTRQEISVPWPNWNDVDLSPGTLIVASPTPFQLDLGEGVSPSIPDLEDLGVSKVRKTYQVDQAGGLGQLRWEVDPPRVDVQVRNQVTVNPDSAEWVAVLRYGVSGGACDTIQLKLPTAWAAMAEVSLEGGSHQLTSESRGASTYLTIRPGQPIWGSQDVTIRAVRSLAEMTTLLFPDLEPSVNGMTEIDVAIVNASGREFTTEGSPGLQPIDDSTRFRSEEFSPLPGLPTNVFRVKSKGWSLKIEAPGGASLASDLDGGLTETALNESDCVVSKDGSVLGSMRCLIEARSGPFFTFTLPEGTIPLWVAFNGQPTRPLRAASGRWLIPIETQDSGELTVIWKSKPLRPLPDGSRAIVFPGVDRSRIPTFISLRLPTDWDVMSRSQVLTAVAPDRQDIARAEKLGRLIADRLSTIDRSSLQDREAIVAMLVDFELLLRSAERASVWETISPSSTREAQIQVIRGRINAARRSLHEAVETAALDELSRAARIHLGLTHDDSLASTPTLELPENRVPVRLRRLGEPRRFEGELDGRGTTAPALLGTPVTSSWLNNPQSIPNSVWMTFLFPPIVWSVARRSGRATTAEAVILFVLLTAITALSGLWTFFGGFLMGVLGWMSGQRTDSPGLGNVTSASSSLLQRP